MPFDPADALLGWAIGKVADTVINQLSQRVKGYFNKDDLQMALEKGIVAAERAEQELASDLLLFALWEPKEIRSFKEKVLSQQEINQELKRPLENQGKPRLEFLKAGFSRVAAPKKLNDVALERWLKNFIDAYFEKTSAIQFQVAWMDYQQQVIHYFQDVQFAGIAVEGQIIEEAKKLTTIFVMPDVVGEKLRSEIERVISFEFDALRPREELAEARKRQQELLQEQRHRVRQAENQWSGSKVLASQLLKKNGTKKVVLLGEPGSGKTTLLKYFAVTLAKGQTADLGLAEGTEWLPILIQIRELVLHPEMSIVNYIRHFAETTLSMSPLPGGFFEAWLQDGRALILLDGLDEVAEDRKRLEMVQKINTFLAQYENNRAIITSRPVGYRRDFFRTAEYAHHLIQPFDDEKINTFIDHWYDTRTRDKAEAERQKDSLRKALAENDRIELLARNPLLLTIIALIHRYQAQLPRERYKLYDKAVETLLRTWDANREITNHKTLEYLRLDDVRRLMEQLAYWIHSQGATGDNQGGTLIDKDSLLSQLSRYIQELKKNLERYQAREEAERFLKLIRERTGLLNEQGKDCYAFVHKTFQEYLAAQEINDRKGDGFEVVLKHIQDHLHDPHWREVLLLLITQQKRMELVNCLNEILNFDDPPYDKWLHRNLFFAGSCLAENISVSDSKLVDKILSELVELETSKSSDDIISSKVFRTLCGLYDTEFEQAALKKLKQAPIEKIGKVRLQNYRAALGDKEGAVSMLLNLLRDDNSSVRSRAADALGELGETSEEVISGLLNLLRDDDSSVRCNAAWALGELGETSEQVISGLLNLLRDDDSSFERYNAAWALAQLGETSEEVISGLLNLLRDDDSSVRYYAAQALERLVKKSTEIVPALVVYLEQNPSEENRATIIDALWRFIG